jgi:hypothetical protein
MSADSRVVPLSRLRERAGVRAMPQPVHTLTPTLSRLAGEGARQGDIA